VQPLTSFGSALLGRHQATADPADLDEAVTALTWAVQAAKDETRAPRVTAELVRALTLRYTSTGNRGDLQAAQGQLEQVSRLDGHPDRGLVGLRWGQLLAAEAAAADSPGTARAAYHRFQEAARDPVAPAPIRFEAATGAGEMAAGQHDALEAADAYASAVDLLPELAWRGLDRRDQEAWLARTGGVVANAAAWAIESGSAGHAVELLEAGRAVMWSQIAQLGSDLRQLSAVHPELAAELEELRGALRAQDRWLSTSADPGGARPQSSAD
jgi:hypothetical protein